MITETVKCNQTIADFCIEKYGTLENLNDLINDNLLKFDATLITGQSLSVNEKLGNKEIKNEFKILKYSPITNLL